MDAGYIRRATMADSPLALYVYTEHCQFENAWDDYTRMARGLIIDTKEVVATPFPKFFNYGQVEKSIPDLPFETFEKVDGSLIIIFHHDGEWKTATKGSLTSPQAQWAKQKLSDYFTKWLIPGVTYLCEGIYPENKIVVNYSGKSALVLLGGYWPEGEELDYEHLKVVADDVGFDLVQRHSYRHISELLSEMPRLPRDREGFVVRFENGFRLKIKGDEYSRIHRMISHCTPLAIWDLMKSGSEEDIWKYRSDLPDEFQTDFDIIVAKVGDQINDLVERTTTLALALKDKSDKEIGLMLDSIPADIRSFIFPYRKTGNLLTGRAKEALFRAVRPHRNYLKGYEPSSSVNRFFEESA